MRKWFTKLILAGLLAIAAPETARAADWYINTAGSDDSSGTSAGAAVATIDRALSLMSNGDRLRFAASTTSYGTLSLYEDLQRKNVTFLGDSAAPNKVKLDQINLRAKQGGADLDNVVVNGVRVVNSVNVETSYGTGHADGFHIRNSVVTKHLTLLDVTGAQVRANRIGTDSTESSFRFTALYRPSATVTVKNNVFKFRPLSGSTLDYLLSFNAEEPNYSYIDVDAANNQGTFTLTSYIDKSTMLRGLRNSTFTDNKWTYNDSLAAGAGTQGWLMRDMPQDNIFLRDTIIIVPSRSGANSLFAQMVGSGNVNSGARNTWRHCYFKSSLVSAGYNSAFYWWQLNPGDSVYFNVFACSSATTSAAVTVNSAPKSAFMGHNTIYKKGGGPAIWLRALSAGNCAYWTGPLIFTNNILYTNSTSTTSTGYAAAIQWKHPFNIFSNYNLYAHYGGSGARAILGGSCTGAQTYQSVGATSARFATTGRDGNSVYGSPRFADSLWANFTGTLIDDSTSAAWASGSGGGDMGAKPINAADAIAPSAISDLGGVGTTSSTVTIDWTAVGDDTTSGTATAYDLRYSTSNITEANFLSQQSFAIPAPAVAGTVTEATITGLSAGTRYYFAIKARDERYNWSSLSNVYDVRTTTFGESGEP